MVQLMKIFFLLFFYLFCTVHGFIFVKANNIQAVIDLSWFNILMHFVLKNHEQRTSSVAGHCSDAAMSHDGGCQTVRDRLLPKTRGRQS